MIKTRFRRRAVVLLVPVVVAVGAGSAIAASGPANGAVIRACAAAGNGRLHLAKQNGKCAKGERALAWNHKGPAGASGPAGPAGVAGPAGPAGDAKATAAAEAPASGQADGFLKLDGIAGESGDPAHAGEIDVASLAFGAKNAPGAGGGGGGAKPTFSAITFSKLYDAASPKLFESLVTGQHIASATFSLRRPGAGSASLVTYKLSDVVVTSYDQGNAKERPLLEEVELTFAKVQISYTPANAAPVTTGWDIKAGKVV